MKLERKRERERGRRTIVTACATSPGVTLSTCHTLAQDDLPAVRRSTAVVLESERGPYRSAETACARGEKGGRGKEERERKGKGRERGVSIVEFALWTSAHAAAPRLLA